MFLLLWFLAHILHFTVIPFASTFHAVSFLKLYIQFLKSADMLLLTVTVCLSSVFTIANAAQLEVRDDCDGNFSLCSPNGASSTDAPAVGDEMSSLLADLLSSVQGLKKGKRSVEPLDQVLDVRSSQVSFCCRWSHHAYQSHRLC